MRSCRQTLAWKAPNWIKPFMEVLRTQRSTYNTLLSEGAINEETFTTLVNEVDAAMLNQEISYSDVLLRRTAELPPITHLIMATSANPMCMKPSTCWRSWAFPPPAYRAIWGLPVSFRSLC